DVVDHALAVADVDQSLEHVDDVFLGEDTGPFDLGTTDAAVELHAADGGQVITCGAEEQVVEQGFGSVLGRRLAGTHHAVDLDQGLQLVVGGVDLQGVGDERTAVDLVGVQGLEASDLRLDDLGQGLGGQLGVAFEHDLTGDRMHDGLGGGTAQHVLDRHLESLQASLFDLVDVAGGVTTAPLADELAGLVLDVERRELAAPALRDPLQARAIAIEMEDVGVIELRQDLLGAIAERAQQDGGRQLAATVDTHEHGVLRVELEVQPGTAVGNDARGIEQLARAVGLAAVVIEEHARGTVQLGHDDALGTVDDEGTVLGHQ